MLRLPKLSLGYRDSSTVVSSRREHPSVHPCDKNTKSARKPRKGTPTLYRGVQLGPVEGFTYERQPSSAAWWQLLSRAFSRRSVEAWGQESHIYGCVVLLHFHRVFGIRSSYRDNCYYYFYNHHYFHVWYRRLHYPLYIKHIKSLIFHIEYLWRTFRYSNSNRIPSTRWEEKYFLNFLFSIYYAICARLSSISFLRLKLIIRYIPSFLPIVTGEDSIFHT